MQWYNKWHARKMENMNSAAAYFQFSTGSGNLCNRRKNVYGCVEHVRVWTIWVSVSRFENGKRDMNIHVRNAMLNWRN